jgi:hypothetical protein
MLLWILNKMDVSFNVGGIILEIDMAPVIVERSYQKGHTLWAVLSKR